MPVLQDPRLSGFCHSQQQTPRTVSSSTIGTTIIIQQTRGRIPLTLTFHLHNISVKSIILKNFSQPLFVSYKRDKNITNFLVNSTLKSDHQPGAFKCPFISNVNKISGPKRAFSTNDHFTCIFASVTYCITYTLCQKIYIGETGRRLGDRFHAVEHLRDVEINDKDASKPVARHFNLPNHSQKHVVCGLSPHLGNTESRKNIEQKFIFQISTLHVPVESTNAFYSSNIAILFCCVFPPL